MTNVTIISLGAVTVTDMAGGAPRNGNPLNTSLWGDGFSWETPNDLKLTFNFGETVTLDVAATSGMLRDNPFSGEQATDQFLNTAVTIGGKTYQPSRSSMRWQDPPPVVVEDEYHVTLFDDQGNSYEMVGISITKGYTSEIVGVAFLGDAPPLGTPLRYIQGKSTYEASPSAPFDRLTTDPSKAPCFLRGTRIATPTGARPIEDLVAGDWVMTADHGARQILWAGSSVVAGTGLMAPVRIRAGRLGNDRDLLVLQNHRLMVSGAWAELYLGLPEVLIAARHLVDQHSITIEPQEQVEYFHLLLEGHQILLAEGAAAESLYLGDQAMRALDPAARAEIEMLFPDRPWQKTLSRPEVGASMGRLLQAA